MDNEAAEPSNESPHAHHHHHSTPGDERTYNIVYLTRDGARHEEQVTGHGHHEAVAKVREKGATDILHVTRAGQASPAIKVKKSRLTLLLKIAAALIATAITFYLVITIF